MHVSNSIIALAIAAGLATPVLAQAPAAGTTPAPPQAAAAEAGCPVSWLSADTDKSGGLSREEVAAVTAADFARIDFDADGTITQAEWENCGLVGQRSWGR